MGVDFYTCHSCEDTFPDFGDYVTCESCGTHWCSDECAEEEGYIEEHCTKYNVYGYIDLNAEREIRGCNHNYCGETCEFYVLGSCKFCRNEDYEDYELLSKALHLLGMTRDKLIKKMKAE